jgi:hypothetical protein
LAGILLDGADPPLWFASFLIASGDLLDDPKIQDPLRGAQAEFEAEQVKSSGDG